MTGRKIGSKTLLLLSPVLHSNEANNQDRRNNLNQFTVLLFCHEGNIILTSKVILFDRNHVYMTVELMRTKV